ncbi:hypothetical protein M413DRAFT_372838 [Hebeloma cylindrosporum]|uniref:Ketosynthase family 3 (KS3) domain-containing protein n=1 Tax=Hebeloma cylindrosporum TaxID=76867 RepID=A0A0C3C555_HEBCY|nr:hypothetical protein M413DRAFT_372838 [Hebeloma cylindrosporum h7]
MSGPHHETALSMQVSEITRKIAAINRTLLPPERISWSRVLILESGVEIPYTKKGMVFRKKLEGLFGDALASLINKDAGKGKVGGSLGSVTGTLLDCNAEVPRETEVPKATSEKWSKEKVDRLVVEALASGLDIDLEVLRANSDSSFAELGMNSDMAVRIVNKLNEIFSLKLPLNTCHTYIDLKALLNAIMVVLGIKEDRPLLIPPTKKRPSLELEEVVIVGQAVRLPGDINTPDAFWDALIYKRDDLMTKAPPDRWDADSFYRSPNSTAPPRNGDIIFQKSGFVDVAHFDNGFFGISKPEALYVSPATRLTLETAFEALENAGIPMSKVKGTNMGVFVATGMDPGYNQL